MFICVVRPYSGWSKAGYIFADYNTDYLRCPANVRLVSCSFSGCLRFFVPCSCLANSRSFQVRCLVPVRFFTAVSRSARVRSMLCPCQVELSGRIHAPVWSDIFVWVSVTAVSDSLVYDCIRSIQLVSHEQVLFNKLSVLHFLLICM